MSLHLAFLVLASSLSPDDPNYEAATDNAEMPAEEELEPVRLPRTTASEPVAPFPPPYDWSPPAAPSYSPASLGGPSDGLEWNSRPSQVSAGQADTSNVPFPYSIPRSLALGTAIVTALWALSDRRRARAFGVRLMQTIRQRAALTICGGIALIAADYLVGEHLVRDYYWRDNHEAGWIALTGVMVALTGIYHWIAGPPDPKI